VSGRNGADRVIGQIVALRRVAGAVDDPVERRRIARVVRELRHSVGVGVPKRRAAAALGVSVQALDHWIAVGRLPTTRRPGSSRTLVDTESLLLLAEETERERESGKQRSVLAAAFRRLEGAGRMPRKLRPNLSAAELRDEFRRTTPAERVRTVAELSHVAGILAAQGACARRRHA
jgi:hypothetical protein